jgi:type I restriction enzyme M protein
MNKNMSKLRNKNKKSVNTCKPEKHYTEWTGAAVLSEWINNILQEKNIRLGEARVEEIESVTKKRADITIHDIPMSGKNLCIIECKIPSWDVYNIDLVEEARKKANNCHAPYFATCNFRKLVWWNTEKANNPNLMEPEKIINAFDFVEFFKLDKIEKISIKNSIVKGLTQFLEQLCNIHTGKETEPKHAIDEYLIFRLHEKIRVLARHYSEEIEQQAAANSQFARNIQAWFIDQNWDFHFQRHDYEKASRQAAYLLVNKILFYNVLQAKQKQLDPLEIPESLTTGSRLKRALQGYFDDVLEIDYETVYSADFIDNIAFNDNDIIVNEIKELVRFLNQYDFSKISYDIIGRIFERLIPSAERHAFGQYFTNANVVDIILSFCLKHEDDELVDPSCGTGTFLVRAYHYKKLMNQRLSHEELLQTIWGNDIAKFPAHLATINLALRDLGVEKNYPNIIQEDFFNIQVAKEGFDLPKRYRKRLKIALGKNSDEITYPRWFDAIVGNPPYTRQEEISDIGINKDNLINNALKYGQQKIATISKRAGIYAYFFVHGWKLLKEGGRFGFIVSNSWLDVEYGKGLQEFFLQYFKIVAIIESKVERWFEEADINTVIIILEKCKEKKQRNENLVRFVYLKRPLVQFVPPAGEVWDEQIQRKNDIDALKKTIFAHNEFYENSDLRIFPKAQHELWEEGFDIEKQKYNGAKWGKYLRAPNIFFTMLKKGKDTLIPLQEIAHIKRGFTTGVNEFFYLKEEDIKKRKIEKKFWMHKNEAGEWIPNYIIKSPRECSAIKIAPDDLTFRVLMIHKDKEELKGTNVLKYIKLGERKKFHKRKTCASRKNWYDLGEKNCAGVFLHPMIHNVRQLIAINCENVYVDHNLFEIRPYKENWLKYIALFMVSTPSLIIKELGGRGNLGEGALKTEGVDIARFFVVNPEKISDKIIKKLDAWLLKNPCFTFNSIFEDIGTQNLDKVSFENIRAERRALDQIIMGDILGLSEDEQLEVYKAVIDLIQSRIGRAKSVKNHNKVKEGIDTEAFVLTVLEKIGEKHIGKFYHEHILPIQTLDTKRLPSIKKSIRIEKELYGWNLVYGKDKIHCQSHQEADYLKIFAEIGLNEVKISKNIDDLKALLPELEKLKDNAVNIMDSYLESVVNQKMKERLKEMIWRKIFEDGF